MAVEFTSVEFQEFNQLTLEAVHTDQLRRITGRLQLSDFVALHSKEKCDAMWAKIPAKDKL